jgi:ribonuclease PH
VDAINAIDRETPFETYPLKGMVSAVSVGIRDSEVILDLCYEEDSAADVDMNIIMNDRDEYVEIQGTGEERPFTATEMAELISKASKGNKDIQRQVMDLMGEDLKRVVE